MRTSCLYIDRCLARLEADEKAGQLLGDRAASVLTAAERTLPVFWGADPAALPAEMRAKIDGYPATLRLWVDKINELKSQEQLVAVRKEWDAFGAWHHTNQDKKWQERVEKNADAHGRIVKLMQVMTPGPAFDAAGAVLLDCQRHQNHLGRAQLTAYNKWALERCHEFAIFALTYTVVWDATLKQRFEAAGITEVDAGLLGTDARRIYDVTIGLIESKLKDRNRAEFLLKLTEGRKWQLSDF